LHGFGIELKPLDGFDRRRVDAHVFHSCDEVERVAAVLAFAEAVPEVFADGDPKLCGIVPFVDRTRPTEAVSAAFERVQETVMVEDLFHGDGRFDGFEVNEQ